jgi:F0F1-type ATP synthase membrane subunit c/vacuolar-type H+-ATPase subunit K
MTPIFLGGLIAHAAQRTFGAASRDPQQAERLSRRGMLFAAGMITGEALMGILIAIPIVSTGRADVLALPAALQLPGGPGRLLGLAVLGTLAWWLYRTATRREPAISVRSA